MFSVHTQASRQTCSFSPRGAKTKEIWFYEHPYPNGVNSYIKNPSVVNNAHRDPEELLAEYRKLLAGIAETRNALKNELKAALEVNKT